MINRRKLPDERQGITHKVVIDDIDIYINVGVFDNGKPGEIFVRCGKVGDTISCLLDAWAVAISIGLQYQIPIEIFTKKFSNWNFKPHGITSNKDIRFTSSVLDYISKWLDKRFGEIDE